MGIIFFVPMFNGSRCGGGTRTGATPSGKINLATIIDKKIYGCPNVG